MEPAISLPHELEERHDLLEKRRSGAGRYPFKDRSPGLYAPVSLKTILTARFLYRIFWLLCRADLGLVGVLLAIVNLVLAASTMLSCGLCTVMLLRFSVRRTKEDVGSLYLGVICAEALRLIVATIQLLWNGIRMVTVPFYLPVRLLLWPWLLALFCRGRDLRSVRLPVYVR